MITCHEKKKHYGKGPSIIVDIFLYDNSYHRGKKIVYNYGRPLLKSLSEILQNIQNILLSLLILKEKAIFMTNNNP